MSTSDHAFIRAFAERKTPGDTGHPHFDTATLASESVTVGTIPVAVSQYITQPPMLPPEALDAIAARAAHADSPSDSGPNRRRLRIDNVRVQPINDAATVEVEDARQHGLGQSHGQPAPHVDSRRLQAARPNAAQLPPARETTVSEPDRAHPAGGTAAPANPLHAQETRTSSFTATWEVDHFRWPEICTRLQSAAAARLTSVLRSVLHSAWRGQSVVAVTSFSRGEGKSTVALCLAQMAAACRVRVALVDGDWECPSIATALGVESEHGWDALSKEIGIADVAIRSLDDELVVLPLRPLARPHTAEIEQRAEVVLQALSGAFELVILDAGPMFTASHRWFRQDLTPTIHSALVVRDVRHTDEYQVDDVCARLSNAGIATVAIVENFQQPTQRPAADSEVHAIPGPSTPHV